MANPEHLAILKQGVAAWNMWRIQTPDKRPDLVAADLQDVDLQDAHLYGADLTRANLYAANLKRSDLMFSILDQASLVGADLEGLNLAFISFKFTVLVNAKLAYTKPTAAVLMGANLNGADFTGAQIGYTVFSDVDLSAVRGLDQVKHITPSTIGIDTIYKSKGKISEAFLRGCGVPEDFIKYAHSLVTNPIDYYSCFISYSSKDNDFADRLHADLQSKAIRCWYAPEDLKIGDKFRTRIEESIRVYDKVMVVLSENSIQSAWVEEEVETALERERQHPNSLVLFPIRLDDAIMETKQAWAASLRRIRHIGDFSKWKNHDSYQKAFDRLLRDLKSQTKAAPAS